MDCHYAILVIAFDVVTEKPGVVRKLNSSCAPSAGMATSLALRVPQLRAANEEPYTS